MAATREEMKREALARMKFLKLHSNVIREFRQEGKLNLSENGGFLYWLDDAQQELVRKFEERYGMLVYHVLHNYAYGDEHLALLYVSPDPEEWEYDRDDLKHGTACAYVVNVTAGFCSEFGAIGVEPSIGGLIRTA